MCVTTGRAKIDGTRTMTYATRDGSGRPVHVTAYLNEAHSLTAGANCMLLNFPGRNLEMVKNGPEHTTRFMQSITAGLEDLWVPEFQTRSAFGFSKGFGTPRVERYGDYYVVWTQGPGDILGALYQVPDGFRPNTTPELRRMVEFYMESFPNDSFALACFNGSAQPKHPITVMYEPRDDSILTVPGLDGHDGHPPTPGKVILRDFAVAFAVDGLSLPNIVRYSDDDQRVVGGQWWAPTTVSGFHDNFMGPNQDYRVRVADLMSGLDGRDLAEALV